MSLAGGDISGERQRGLPDNSQTSSPKPVINKASVFGKLEHNLEEEGVVLAE